AFPGVTRRPEDRGLGFHSKWNMGWMHDFLTYIGKDPVHRRYHHDQLTFAMSYAFSERFVLPLSHDEVVHGKGSFIGKMPGDEWQKFANARLSFAYLFAHPGRKLHFMGLEFGQQREWNVKGMLDWHLAEGPGASAFHEGLRLLVRDLNRLYRELTALHQRDLDPEGFRWIDFHDRDQNVIAFLRQGREPGDEIVCVFNFSPVPRHDYRVGVPRYGRYVEILNTDAGIYGGGNVGNLGGKDAEGVPAHNFQDSLSLTLPPLGAVWLRLQGMADGGW